jgi:hypothetical protein
MILRIVAAVNKIKPRFFPGCGHLGGTGIDMRMLRPRSLSRCDRQHEEREQKVKLHRLRAVDALRVLLARGVIGACFSFRIDES